MNPNNIESGSPFNDNIPDGDTKEKLKKILDNIKSSNLEILELDSKKQIIKNKLDSDLHKLKNLIPIDATLREIEELAAWLIQYNIVK